MLGYIFVKEHEAPECASALKDAKHQDTHLSGVSPDTGASIFILFMFSPTFQCYYNVRCV